MPDRSLYRQCELRDLGGFVDVVWVPTDMAYIGARLWERASGPGRIWTVWKVYSTTDRETLDAQRGTRCHFHRNLEPNA